MKLTEEQVQCIKKSLKLFTIPFSERVAPVYKLLDWSWAINPFTKEKDKIPDVSDIVLELVILIDKWDGNLPVAITIGGLEVSFDYDENVNTVVSSIRMSIEAQHHLDLGEK